MPFKSEAQRRYLWSQHPEVARSWSNEGKGYVAAQTDKLTPGDQTDTSKGSGKKGGLPPWLQKAQKNGDMLSSAKKKAIQKRIGASHNKKNPKGK